MLNFIILATAQENGMTPEQCGDTLKTNHLVEYAYSSEACLERPFQFLITTEIQPFFVV
jgi:hypothetical protein